MTQFLNTDQTEAGKKDSQQSASELSPAEQLLARFANLGKQHDEEDHQIDCGCCKKNR